MNINIDLSSFDNINYINKFDKEYYKEIDIIKKQATDDILKKLTNDNNKINNYITIIKSLELIDNNLLLKINKQNNNIECIYVYIKNYTIKLYEDDLHTIGIIIIKPLYMNVKINQLYDILKN